MLVEEARVEVRRLLAGGGVDDGAEAVEELGDLDRRVALGALEQQVLEEVRDAGLRRRLVPRAGPHPEPERHRAHRGNGLGDDPEAASRARSARRLVGGHVGLSGPGRRRARDGRHRRRHARAARPPPPRPPPSRRPPRRARVAGADAASSSGALARDVGVVGEPQADPAALLVDLDHGDVDLVALVEDVLDRVDPLARLHVGDVQQAVGALGQLDEGAEGGRLDDLAAV